MSGNAERTAEDLEGIIVLLLGVAHKKDADDRWKSPSLKLLEPLGNYDWVLTATDHKSYDCNAIVRQMKLIADMRNATRRVKEHREKIENC